MKATLDAVLTVIGVLLWVATALLGIALLAGVLTTVAMPFRLTSIALLFGVCLIAVLAIEWYARSTRRTEPSGDDAEITTDAKPKALGETDRRRIERRMWICLVIAAFIAMFGRNHALLFFQDPMGRTFANCLVLLLFVFAIVPFVVSFVRYSIILYRWEEDSSDETDTDNRSSIQNKT